MLVFKISMESDPIGLVGRSFRFAFDYSPAGKVMMSKPVRRIFKKYQWARIGLQVGAGVVDAITGCVGCVSATASAYLADISGGDAGDIGGAEGIRGQALQLTL